MTPYYKAWGHTPSLTKNPTILVAKNLDNKSNKKKIEIDNINKTGTIIVHQLSIQYREIESSKNNHAKKTTKPKISNTGIE